MSDMCWFPNSLSLFSMEVHVFLRDPAQDNVGQDEGQMELPTVPVQENIPDFLVLCGLTTAEVAWLSGFTRCGRHATLTLNPLATVGQKRPLLAHPTPSLCPGRKRTSSPLRLTFRRGVARVLSAQPDPAGVRCGAKFARARSKGASCSVVWTGCGLDLQGARRRQRRLFSITSRYGMQPNRFPSSERAP